MNTGRHFKANLSVLALRFPELARSLELSKKDSCYKLTISEEGPKLDYTEGDVAFSFPGLVQAHPEHWARHADLDLGIRQTFIVQCFGLGYHVESLMNVMTPDSHVIVVDPDLTPLALALEVRDLAPLLRRPNLEFKISGILDGMEAFLVQHVRIVRPQRVTILSTLPPGKEAYAESLRQIIAKVFIYESGRIQTAERLEATLASHAILNLPALLRSRSAESLKKIFHGKPVVVAGAGPSLEDHLDALKAIQDKVVLVAVDTALPVLFGAGIRPFVVCSVDPRDLSKRHFEKVPKDADFLLWADFGTHPDVVAGFHDRVVFGSIPDTVAGYFQVLKPLLSIVHGGTNVALQAMQAAVYLGASTVYLLGVDLAFKRNQRYAKGVVYQYGPSEYGYRFQTHPQLCESKQMDLEQVRNIRGELAESTPDFIAALHEIENLIKAIDVPCCNCSDFGARIEGAEAGDLVGDVSHAVAVDTSVWADTPASEALVQATRNEIKRLKKDVADLLQLCVRGGQIVRRFRKATDKPHIKDHDPSLNRFKLELNDVLVASEKSSIFSLLPDKVTEIFKGISGPPPTSLKEHLKRIETYFERLTEAFDGLHDSTDSMLLQLKNEARH